MNDTFCTACGTKVKESNKFCPNCDGAVGASEEIAEQVTSPNTRAEVAEAARQLITNGEKNSPAIPIVLTIVLVAIVLIVIGAVSGSGSPQSNSEQVPIAASSTVEALTNVSPSSQSASPSQQSQNTSDAVTPSLIDQIEPSVVVVACFPPNFTSQGDWVYGSGVSVDYQGTTYIQTNYHVYNGVNTGGGMPVCYAVYPQPPDFSTNAQYGMYRLILNGHNYDPNTYEDVANFTLGSPMASSSPLSSIPTINDTSLTGIGAGCSNVQVGDSVHVFGYPAAGNALTVSETVTQGTIAGILPGPIYKFNGTIDHGNSGGLAVLDKNGCVLGIPTLGQSGLTGGIGYIQSVQLTYQPVTLSNDQICQDQYGVDSYYTGSSDSSGNIICGCQSGYVWNYNQTACLAETGYQVCSSEFPNETWNGTYGSDGKYNCVCNYGYVQSPTGNGCESGYTYCQNYGGYADTYNSLTGQCECTEGYAWNGSSCVSYTPNQICERDVGPGSYWLGYKNPDGTYACSNLY